MKRRFDDRKFFLAGVIANLNIDVNGLVENYRFVYPILDIQREVLFGGDVKPVDNSNIHIDETPIRTENGGTYLLALVGIILAAVTMYCVYTKWIRKWLRHRRQKLADQGSSSFKYT